MNIKFKTIQHCKASHNDNNIIKISRYSYNKQLLRVAILQQKLHQLTFVLISSTRKMTANKKDDHNKAFKDLLYKQ